MGDSLRGYHCCADAPLPSESLLVVALQQLQEDRQTTTALEVREGVMHLLPKGAPLPTRNHVSQWLRGRKGYELPELLLKGEHLDQRKELSIQTIATNTSGSRVKLRLCHDRPHPR